jgi:hypothetical protein
MTRADLRRTTILACLVLGAAGASCGGSSSPVNRDGAPDSPVTTDGGMGGADGATTTGTGGSAGMDGALGTGTGGATGTDGSPSPCTPGVACTDGQSCTTSMRCPNNRERACFCSPNNVLACEACQEVDAGTDAGPAVDGGVVMACPSGVSKGTACADEGTFCSATCSNGQAQTCFCTTPMGGRPDSAATTWNCLRMCTVP